MSNSGRGIMEEQKKKRLVGFSLILVASLLNGLIPSFTQKVLQSGLPLETILTTRYLLGASLIWLYIFAKRKNFKVGKSNIAFMLSLGFMLFLCTSSVGESYKYLPGAVSVILAFLYVFIVVFIEILIGREKAEKKRVFCLILAVAGLGIVVWPVDDIPHLRLLGILFALMGAFFYAMQTLGIGSKRLKDIEAEIITGYMILFIFGANLLRTLVLDKPILPTNLEQWGWILVIGVGAAFVAPLCFCKAVKIIGGSDTALTNTTEPVFAYLAGIIIMGDRISWNATLGGILVVSSVIILNLPKNKKKRVGMIQL
jgi:drug/metabolite transporter (DMT)-like permease